MTTQSAALIDASGSTELSGEHGWRRQCRETRGRDRPFGRTGRRPDPRREGSDLHRHLRPGPGDRKHPGDDPVRRPCAADRRSRPRQDQAGRNARHHARARRQAHPVHAGPDAVGHSRRRGAGREQLRQALVPLHRRTGVRAAADGRRNQPRQPAHPVGAAAGHAGAAHHGCRRAPRSAEAVPRARDAKPAGAGRHLSAAGSAARPLPDGDRRRLSRSRRRAPHPVRNHRRRRDAGQGRR